MKWILFSLLSVIFVAGCQPSNPTPDQLREDTAKATHDAVQDAKAVTQGVVDGVRQSRPVNINSATHDQLMNLPGVDDERAGRIIANRPYDRTEDLVKKHVVPQSEYDKISAQVTAK